MIIILPQFYVNITELTLVELTQNEFEFLGQMHIFNTAQHMSTGNNTAQHMSTGNNCAVQP